MKILKRTYQDRQHIWADFSTYFGGRRYAVFDIETTGLSPKTSQLILSGFVVPEGNGDFTMTQIFAQSLHEEEEVIEATLDFLKNVDYIITFNGRSFDVPFLAKRMRKLGITSDVVPEDIYNLDIYTMVRRYSQLRQFLPNLKQKTVENFMGLWTEREDEIDGAASVRMYMDYLVSGDPETERKILLHNSDDVMQLNRLAEVLKKTEFHRGMFCEGFPAGRSTVTSVRISRGTLICHGKCSTVLPPASFFMDDSGVEYQRKNGTFQLTLRLSAKEDLLFADLDNIFSSDHDRSAYEKCNALYMDRYLLISAGGEIYWHSANLLTIELIERIENNEL